ncbi:MAG: hypothetical protein CL607_06115 [Anaerolineaceae bacterium]|nr:hypothetical protein [Anaerolineaceae bacterium]
MYLRRLALLLLLLMTVTSVTLAQWPESYTVEKQYMVGTIVIFGSLIVLVPWAIIRRRRVLREKKQKRKND